MKVMLCRSSKNNQELPGGSPQRYDPVIAVQWLEFIGNMISDTTLTNRPLLIATSEHFLTDLSGNSMDSSSYMDFIETMDVLMRGFPRLPLTIFFNALVNVSVADVQRFFNREHYDPSGIMTLINNSQNQWKDYFTRHSERILGQDALGENISFRSKDNLKQNISYVANISVVYNFVNQTKIQRLKSGFASYQAGLADYFNVRDIRDAQPYYYEGFPEAAIIQPNLHVLHRICLDYAIWDETTLNNDRVMGYPLIIQSDSINPYRFFEIFPLKAFRVADYESSWPTTIIFQPTQVTGDPLLIKLAQLIAQCPFLVFADSAYDVAPWLPSPYRLGTPDPAYADVTGGIYITIPQRDGTIVFIRQSVDNYMIWDWNHNHCNGFDYSFYQF